MNNDNMQAKQTLKKCNEQRKKKQMQSLEAKETNAMIKSESKNDDVARLQNLTSNAELRSRSTGQPTAENTRDRPVNQSEATL